MTLALRRVVEKNACGVSFRVVILLALKTPNEGSEPQRSKDQRDWYQNGKNIHSGLHRTRNAFNITVIDEVDIASAANSGVASPAKANGIATRL